LKLFHEIEKLISFVEIQYFSIGGQEQKLYYEKSKIKLGEQQEIF